MIILKLVEIVREEEAANMYPCIKIVNLLLALILLAFFSFGCAGTSSGISETPKDTRIKCAKCSTSYSIEEGLSETQGSGGGK